MVFYIETPTPLSHYVSKEYLNTFETPYYKHMTPVRNYSPGDKNRPDVAVENILLTFYGRM